MPRNPSCIRCPLHLSTTNVCVWGYGNEAIGGLMLLGEAPGAEEEASGLPFVGAAGRELDSALEAVGHSRGEVYIANASKCRPPGNRTPLTSESSACFPYLAEEISKLQPKVILCLGGSALKALTGKDSVTANRGKPVEVKPTVRIGDAKVFVTYHPAAVLHPHNPEEKKRIRESILQDFKLAFSLIDDTRSKHTDHKRALLAEPYSVEDLKKGLDALAKCKVVACDLEWTALKDRGISWPWSKGTELYTISLSGRNGENVLSLAFSWPPPEGGYELVKDFFAKVPVVFHNALADLNWLESLGFKTKLGGDTLILAFLMDEEQRLSLEQLTPLYTDIAPGWKIPPRSTRPSTTEEWEELLEYNANDTYATLKLAEALHKRLESLSDRERNGIKKIYYKLLLPVVPTLVSMALSGIPMYPEDVGNELVDSINREKVITRQIAERVGCNPHQAAELAGSPAQTLAYLKEAYGLEIDSSRKDDLVGYEDEYPIIGDIQAYRWEHNKVQGTYLGPWHELLLEQEDRRLHSVYRLTFARTGRTSAEIEKGGSLQLMPRNQDGRELKARNLVKAFPGYKIVAADYSQVELRVMAWLSGDATMLRLFHEGADLHTATAAFIKANPMPLEEFWPRRAEFMKLVTKDERQGAKGVNFGLVFGLQPEGLMEYCKLTYGVDMTIGEAIEAHGAYFRMYSGVKAYHEYCRAEIFPRGYTETPFGRFRRKLEDPNKAINTPTQTTASDLTLYAMHNISVTFKESEWPAEVVGFVHDSVICHVKDEFVDRAEEVIRECMEHPDLRPLGVFSLPVPLKSDILVGDTWGTATERVRSLVS